MKKQFKNTLSEEQLQKFASYYEFTKEFDKYKQERLKEMSKILTNYKVGNYEGYHPNI